MLLNYEETRLQKACIKWAAYRFPETDGLLCYNLNNSANSRSGKMNKELGLIAGRADVVLYWKGTAYMFEFKAPLGYQTKTQKDWQAKIEAHGFKYFVIRTSEQFIKTFEQIITLC